MYYLLDYVPEGESPADKVVVLLGPAQLDAVVEGVGRLRPANEALGQPTRGHHHHEAV